MDSSVIIAIIALVSSLGGIVVASRYTARTARQAQETTKLIEEKKLDASSWQEQVKSWRDDVRQLRELRAQDRADHETEMSKCMTRIDNLEEARRRDAQERARDRAHLDAFVSWSRMVAKLLRQADIAYPPPPPGVEDTSPG